MSLYRVLRNTKTTLTKAFYVDDVETPPSDPVGFAITREDGTAVQSGSASGPDANGNYTFQFQGSAVLDRLNVTWLDTLSGASLDLDSIEVAGAFYFSAPEARAIDQVFTNTTRYPVADLTAVRIETEDECEAICEQAFVPRFEREVLDGHPHQRHLVLKWPYLRKVRALTVDGVAWTSDQLAAVGRDRLGVVRPNSTWSWFWGIGGGFWPYGIGNIVVEYEHGLDRPPTDIVRGARQRWKALMFERKSRSALPAQAERTQTTEQGVVSLATPTQWTTGIPSTDAAYARHPSPRPDFG